MKACLNCQKEYENKRKASKFCSDKCRVQYNRKNPKKTITPVQMQVLYNAVLEMIGNMDKPTFKGITEAQNGTPTAISNTTQRQLKPPKTMAKYFEDKQDCSCEEDYHTWLAEVDADPYLTSKQRTILKTTNPSRL